LVGSIQTPFSSKYSKCSNKTFDFLLDFQQKMNGIVYPKMLKSIVSKVYYGDIPFTNNEFCELPTDDFSTAVQCFA